MHHTQTSQLVQENAPKETDDDQPQKKRKTQKDNWQTQTEIRPIQTPTNRDKHRTHPEHVHHNNC